MWCAAREGVVLSIGFDVDECLVCFCRARSLWTANARSWAMFKLMDMYSQHV